MKICLWLTAILFLFSNNQCPAKDIGYAVTGEIKSNYPIYFDENRIKDHTVKLASTDPNFPEKTAHNYEGVSLESIQKLTESRDVSEITLIAKDQYISYLPASIFNFKSIILAHMVDNQPIPVDRGGPVKVIYPNDIKLHPAANAWYVEMVFMGKVSRPALSVTSQGKTVSFSREELMKFKPEQKKQIIPIPKGYRHDIPPLPRTPLVTSILLKNLLKDVLNTGTRIRMVPMAGRDFVIDTESITEKPIRLAIAINGEAFNPVFGGPFSVIFPVIEYPEMTGKVPGTGGLFFVTSLIVEP